MKVVGYCRLSRDEDKENYASIEEQKIILQDYAMSRGWKILDRDFYIDDNFSGYTLDRPKFSKMLRKVQRGDIDVVLAKDLSRIGRNNGKVLVLIDGFKAMQKNLILVSEMGGCYDVLNDRDDTIGITTWYNERYVKDCSKKTRDHMLSKQKTGRLIMGNYYGYVKDPDDITKLTVDEEIRQEYLKIFKEFSSDVFLISAATKENIKPFLDFVMQKVDEIPKPEFKIDIEEDLAAFDNDDSDYAVYKIDKNTYSVEGGKIIRLANVTDTRNIDQLYRFQNILASMNVYEALKQAGIKEGDVVKIGHIQFDYYD